MTAWIVTSHEAGNRLDRVLAARLGVSRSQVRRLLEAGRVTVGDASGRVAGGSVVTAGMRITVAEDAEDLVATAEVPARGTADDGTSGTSGPGGDPGPGGALQVLAEGPGWVAVNKPAGIAVHPLRLGETGTLLNRVVGRYPQVRHVGGEGELRSGVVHRLDVDTSGVVVFALTDDRWAELRAAFSGHRVVKRYRALVAGRVAQDGRHEATLAVVGHHPARVAVVDEGDRKGRRCSLAWRVLGRGEGATEIEVDLHTGFLHQVRVMMAALGHPVLGDAGYGGGATSGGGAAFARRQMLHAASLSVGDIAATAPLPEDYVRCSMEAGTTTNRGAP